MKLRKYLTETTEPTVELTTRALKPIFAVIKSLFERFNIFNMNDKTALNVLQKAFDMADIKLEMGTKSGARKYFSGGEFGGKYGGDYVWLIRLKPGFSDIFKRLSTERAWRYIEDPNKNPFFRELIEILSHEILHTQQALRSGGKSFDAKLQGAESTYTGNYTDYLKHPLEIEAYAQQAAIDTIRKGEKNSFALKNYKNTFPKGSKILNKFMKKYAYYLEALRKEGDIQSYK